MKRNLRNKMYRGSAHARIRARESRPIFLGPHYEKLHDFSIFHEYITEAEESYFEDATPQKVRDLATLIQDACLAAQKVLADYVKLAESVGVIQDEPTCPLVKLFGAPLSDEELKEFWGCFK